MILGKENKILWDVETTSLNEKAYELLLANTERWNNELARKKQDKRCSYITLGDFIQGIEFHKSYIEQANIYLRKEKIKKLKK